MNFETPGEWANRVIEVCDSTNDLARVLGVSGYPHGTWVASRVQNKGRGRLGRKWESQRGNLFLSMVARIRQDGDRSLLSWVPLVSAVTVAKALREINSCFAVEIKWPNDLWILGSKVGGILCEGAHHQGRTFIVVGLGLNFHQPPEGLLDQGVTSLVAVATDRGILLPELDSIRISIVHSLASALGELSPESIQDTVRLFNAWSAIPAGSEIQWGLSACDDPKTPGTKSGVVEGLGSYGELIVKNASGEKIKLYAEDVKSIKTLPKAACGSPV